MDGSVPFSIIMNLDAGRWGRDPPYTLNMRNLPGGPLPRLRRQPKLEALRVDDTSAGSSALVHLVLKLSYSHKFVGPLGILGSDRRCVFSARPAGWRQIYCRDPWDYRRPSLNLGQTPVCSSMTRSTGVHT